MDERWIINLYDSTSELFPSLFSLSLFHFLFSFLFVTLFSIFPPKFSR